jgi:DNA-binding NarL/FixJ family response regulator
MNGDRETRLVRVALIDDHSSIIEMLTQVVDGISGYKVVGSAKDAVKGLAMCRETKPDIVVLDLVMPGVSGLSVMDEIKASCPKARVLIFAGSANPASVYGAMSAGVAGFVEKTCSLSEFRCALTTVGSGRVYFDSHASEIIKNMIGRNPPAPSARARLTPREKTVLGYIANGMSSKEIASLMDVSVHTVNNHRSRMMQKLGLHRVAQLTLHAARIGLVSESDGRPGPSMVME